MNLASLKTLGQTIIEYGAPILGGVIGGAPGAAIGQLVANEFGGDIKDPEALALKISSDPQAAVKLAEIQSNHKIELQKLLITSEENRLKYETQQLDIDAKNTADARNFNVQTNSVYPQMVSTIVVVGFFACIYWIAAYPQDASDHDVLNILLGVIGTSFGVVVNFWLGSSHDRKKGNKE